MSISRLPDVYRHRGKQQKGENAERMRLLQTAVLGTWLRAM